MSCAKPLKQNSPRLMQCRGGSHMPAELQPQNENLRLFKTKFSPKCGPHKEKQCLRLVFQRTKEMIHTNGTHSSPWLFADAANRHGNLPLQGVSKKAFVRCF